MQILSIFVCVVARKQNHILPLTALTIILKRDILKTLIIFFNLKILNGGDNIGNVGVYIALLYLNQRVKVYYVVSFTTK